MKHRISVIILSALIGFGHIPTASACTPTWNERLERCTCIKPGVGHRIIPTNQCLDEDGWSSKEWMMMGGLIGLSVILYQMDQHRKRNGIVLDEMERRWEIKPSSDGIEFEYSIPIM